MAIPEIKLIKIERKIPPKIPPMMQVQEEFDKLLKYAENKKLILEIGTALGGALYRIMKVANPTAEIISIDMPKGLYGGEYGQPNIEDMQSWKQPNQTLHIIRKDSQKSIDEVKGILKGRKFDFLFIDGDHSYEGVKKDYEVYKEFADDVIVFHDIAKHRRDDVGVKRLWDEIEGNKIEIINNINQGWAGIGVLIN